MVYEPNLTQEEQIELLVANYRKLKVQYDKLENKMKEIKQVLAPLVEAKGSKWQDDQGYVRFVEQQAGVTCDAKAVHKQAQIWALSSEPQLQTAGATILQHFADKPANRYLQVK
jgi:hypothetical protein